VPTPTTHTLSRRATRYVAAICIAILGLEGWREWLSYEQMLEQSAKSNYNLAHSLRQHADDTFELAEQTVSALGLLAQRIMHVPGGLEAIGQRMRQNLASSSRLYRIDMFDQDGAWRASSSPERPLEGVPTGYGYFQNHRDSISQAPFIGPPVQLPTGELVLTISQRLNLQDGSFGGIVVAMLDSKFFVDFYTAFSVGQLGSISLLNTGGSLLARTPYDPSRIGSDLRKSKLFTRELAVRDAGIYESVSFVDGVERIHAFDRSHRYPIVAMVSVSRDELMAPWLTGTVQHLAFAAGLVLALGLLGMRLAEQIKRRQRSDVELMHREKEFRLLAESASDVVERLDLSGRRLYVSPAVERVLGLSADQLLAQNAFDSVHPDDRPAAHAAMERLRGGLSCEEVFVFRARHADGHEVWIETALRVAAGDTPEDTIVVAVSRDVTERKLHEIKLASLATTDGLTGLANRRTFDEAVEREVARARRAGTPLSLLMIDCDRFKRFNDDYGHLAGDEVLKTVAKTIMAKARRPLDVAARFGGEEMALLLPETSMSAARAIGLDVCREVHGLGIPHSRNPPWAVATVSVGLATFEVSGQDDTRDSAWLVTTADLALYGAKAQGRNQCVAGPLADAERWVG
jgi:diguanylate cyclase (GGDEF)-like protein/PAS domain S-box-containing protein